MTSSPVLVSQAFDGQTGEINKSGHTVINLADGDDLELILPDDVADRLVKRTEMRVSQVLSQSTFVRSNLRLYDLPRVEREDLDIGGMIAYGGFSNVYEIKGFRNGSGDDLEQNRQYILKNLNPKLAYSPKKLVVGAKDLVMEAHFLSALNHKHVIKLRAWSAAGIAGFSETGRADGFFLIFDRLKETLSRRIADWREQSKESKKGSFSGSRSNIRLKLFNERVQAAIDIASAMEYLHTHRIVYRDLKPANVGFDQNGELKIFDFGLAVELPEGSQRDSTFNLAGNTGTSRYMAPEVIRKQPYNTKCDVFSFSVVLWELMALCKPFDGLMGEQVKECVAVFGERPSIPRTWPTGLRRLLKRGWADALQDRPHMDEVREVLEKLYESSSKPKSLFGKS